MDLDVGRRQHAVGLPAGGLAVDGDLDLGAVAVHGAGAPADHAVAGVAERDLDRGALAHERAPHRERHRAPGHDDGAVPRAPLQRRVELGDGERVGRGRDASVGRADAAHGGVGREPVALADSVVGQRGHGWEAGRHRKDRESPGTASTSGSTSGAFE